MYKKVGVMEMSVWYHMVNSWWSSIDLQQNQLKSKCHL